MFENVALEVFKMFEFTRSGFFEALCSSSTFIFPKSTWN